MKNNPSAKYIMEIYKSHCVDKTTCKGNKIVFIFAESNSGKTTLAQKGIGAVLVGQPLQFDHNWYVNIFSLLLV